MYGIRDLEALRGALDQLGGGIGQWQPAARPVHVQRDVVAAGLEGGGVVLERWVVGLDRAAVIAEGGHEEGLELTRDRTGDADVDVVELAVGEVVLDARAADVRHPAVDEDELAVLDAPCLPGVRHGPPLADRTVAIRGDQVVQHDLDARRGEVRQHPLRVREGVAAERIEDEPHLDAVARLGRKRPRERVTDDAGLEAVLHDVDRAARRRDVLEHPRIEGVALHQHLDVRGGRRRPRSDQVRVDDLVDRRRSSARGRSLPRRSPGPRPRAARAEDRRAG